MFCRKCGNQIPDDSEFCPKCGARVELINDSPSEPATAAVNLEKPAPEVEITSRRCEFCGKDVFSNEEKCSRCNAPNPMYNGPRTSIPKTVNTSQARPNTSSQSAPTVVVPTAPVSPGSLPKDALRKSKGRPKKGLFIGLGIAAVAVFCAIFIPVQVANHKKAQAIYAEEHHEFKYHFDENGNCTIDEYLGDELDVVIPDTIQNQPVCTINEGVFSGKNIKTVTIGKNTRMIGAYAFSNCKELRKVTFSNENYADMGNLVFMDNAFSDCISLRSVELPRTDIHIFDQAFSSCRNLSDINLINVLSIGKSAFKDCSSLTSINLRDITFSSQCFMGCTSLTEVRCTSCGNLIGTRAFENCKKLELFMIGGYAFYEPSEIEQSGVIVGVDAFKGCEEFVRFTLKDYLNQISSR